MKLRLLLLEECNRNCAGCCNKDWDLSTLQVCDDYSKYDSIMLTGGEPMLCPELVREAVSKIRSQTSVPVFLYTAEVKGLDSILTIIDGVTLTLHTKEDISPFLEFENKAINLNGKSLRLNIFEEVGEVSYKDCWKVKPHMAWIKDCPLPDDEVFMRYSI